MPEPQVLRFYASKDDPRLEGVNSALGARVWHEEQILGFDAVARGNAVTEIVITHQPSRPFRIIDTTPARGITLSTGAETPMEAYLQSTRRFHPSLTTDTGPAPLFFNGTALDTQDLTIEADGYTLKVDLSSVGDTGVGTKTLVATAGLIDESEQSLDEGFNLSWQIEDFTNIQAGLRKPPAAEGRTGTLRVTRIAVDHGTNVDKMVKQWQDSLGLTDKEILFKVHVPGQRLDTRVFVLHFERRQPSIVSTFPNSGSVMARTTIPERLTVTTDLPLDPTLADDSGVIEIDGVGVGSTAVTLSSDGRSLEVDLDGFDTAGHHTVRMLGIRGIGGTTIPIPILSSYTFSSLIPTGGTGAGGGTDDHGSLLGLGDDDHTQYHTDARGDARYYTQTQVDTLLGDYQLTSEKDQANGYAGLDASGDLKQEAPFLKADIYANRPAGTAGSVYVSTDGPAGLGGDPVLYVFLNP